MKIGKVLKFKNYLITMMALGGIGAIATITVSSCGVSKSITDNMVNKWAGNGDFAAAGTNISKLSFDDVVRQAATTKSGSTAFKNAVANEIAYNFYKNVVDGKYNNINQQEFKDNWKKWNKQIDDDYKAKIKDYKSNHKYDWPYYFQNEVLDPVGGTEDLWKKYDSQKGLCQYIVKDLIDRAKKGSYLAMPDFISTGTSLDPNNYTYNWKDPVVHNSKDINDGGNNSNHEFLNENGKLDPKNWNFINFYVYADNQAYDTNNLLDEFYVAMQREAFYEWLDRYQPISTSSLLFKYSAPSTRGRDLKSIYNTSETTPNYALPYFDDQEIAPDSTTANCLYGEMYQDAFYSGNDYLWNSSSANYSSSPLSLTNVDQKYNDGKSSTMSLMSIDKYSNFSEFNGPSVYNLWGTLRTSDTNLPYKMALRTKYDQNPGSIDPQPRILANFLASSSGKFGGSDGQDLIDWYGRTNPNDSNSPCNIYNSTSSGNEIVDMTNTINAFQLRKTSGTGDSGDLLPYIMYRGDDGVHLVGLDGSDYLKSSNTSAIFPTDTAWKTEAFSHERENALLKFRALYEKNCPAPFAGAGLKIEDAYKAYLESNFSDVLINTYYRTTSSPTSDIFGNVKNIDDQIDWQFNDDQKNSIGDMSLITKYIIDVNHLFDFQDLVSKYGDANKKLLTFGKKYNDNWTTNEKSWENGLALALPWVPTSGVWNVSGLTNKQKITDTQTHYALVDHLLDRIPTAIIPVSNPWLIENESISELERHITNSNGDGTFDLWSKAQNDIAFNDSKKNYMKYSEHIFAKNHYVADMMWAALGDSTGKISNIERFKIFDSYLGTKTTDKYDIENDFADQITSQYISSKLMTDDSSLPAFANENSGGLIDFGAYVNVLETQWSLKNIRDQGWNNHTSSELIDYLNFLARLQWLAKDNYANFMSYLQNRAGLTNDPSSMLSSPTMVAWLDKDNYTTSKTAAPTNDWKTNYNNQFGNRYENTNNTGSNETRTGSWGSFNQYWQYARLTTGAGLSTNGMGFIGLQTKGNLDNLPDSIATEAFDDFQVSARSGSSSTLDSKGSLYRFGSDKDTIKENITKLLNIGYISQLRTFFDKALPGELHNGNPTSPLYWDGCKQAMDSKTNADDKLAILKDYLLGNGTYDGALDQTMMDDLATPHNCKSGGLYCFSPYNGTYDSRVFGDSNLGNKANLMQINYQDVESVTTLQNALGNEDVFKALVVKAAMTNNFDIKVSQDVLNNAFGSNHKLQVFDRRFNDDADLKNWLEGYKTPN